MRIFVCSKVISINHTPVSSSKELCLLTFITLNLVAYCLSLADKVWSLCVVTVSVVVVVVVVVENGRVCSKGIILLLNAIRETITKRIMLTSNTVTDPMRPYIINCFPVDKKILHKRGKLDTCYNMSIFVEAEA